jgi:hypothetical protein
LYYRLVASVTRDHIKDHLAAYLAIAEDAQDKKVKLLLPKRFDVASYVGGVVGLTMTDSKSFPAVAIDALTRTESPTPENLYTYRYDGQINFMVNGSNPESVELQAKGYLAAFDMFANDHEFWPLDNAYDQSDLPFKFTGFGVTRSAHFGAANVPAEEGKATRVWIDGGTLEISWLVSEAGPGQHP